MNPGQEAGEPQILQVQAIHLSLDEVIAQELEYRRAFPVMHQFSRKRLHEPIESAIPAKIVEMSVDVLDPVLDFTKPLQAAVAAAGARLVPRNQLREPVDQLFRRDIQPQSLDHARRLFSTPLTPPEGRLFKETTERTNDE